MNLLGARFQSIFFAVRVVSALVAPAGAGRLLLVAVLDHTTRRVGEASAELLLPAPRRLTRRRVSDDPLLPLAEPAKGGEPGP